MSATSLFFDIFGRDQGVGDMLDKVTTKAKGMNPVLGGIGTALATGLAGLGGAIVKTGLDEVSDASAGMAQLEAGIKSTGNAANVSVDGLQSLASSIQDYSGQTDDSIVQSEQLLLTFTNIKNNGPDKIFDQATVASADMAAKMGGSASDNAIKLGKALNDPVGGITALSKAGIQFTAQQKDQIKAMVASGDTLGAQKIILGEVTKEFGGAAKAAGDSLPGQVQKSKRAFEDLSQNLMQALLPALVGAASALTGVTKWMSQNQGVAIALAVVVGVLAAGFLAASVGTMAHTVALGIQKTAIGISTAAQWLFNAAMDANPIGLVVIGIAALIAIIVLLATHWTEVVAVVTSIWGGFMGWMQGVLAGFAGFWNGLWAGIGAFFTGLWGGIVSGASDMVGNLLGFFTSLPGQILGVLAGAGSWLLSVGENIVNGLISGIQNMIGGVVKTLTDGLGGAVNAVKDFLGIHSPSLVFHEIGQNIGLGLAGGVGSQGSNVSGAMKSLVALPAIGSALSAGMDRALSTSGPVPGQLPGVTAGVPVIQVFIGNEQLDARMVTIAYKEAGKAVDGVARDLGGRRT